MKLRGLEQKNLVEKEIQQLDSELAHINETKWSDFLKTKSLYRPLIIAVFIKVAQHFSGINAVIF